MKKLLSIIVLFTLLLTLTGCATPVKNTATSITKETVYVVDYSLEEYQYCTTYLIIKEDNRSYAEYVIVAMDKDLEVYQASLMYFVIVDQYLTFEKDWSYTVRCTDNLLFERIE